MAKVAVHKSHRGTNYIPRALRENRGSKQIRRPPSPELEDAEETEEQEVLFEPYVEELIGPLIQQYIQNQMYTAWLGTLAGEHAARMTAMDSATKNAGEMIKQLNLYYNRSRQAAITKELIEIISGAESL